MAGNLTAMIASIFSGSAVSTDPYFNLTTLLLSTTATNGQQNNTFQDSSTNNFNITRNPATGPNAPTQGTFSPFSQTGWGGAFNTSTTYLTVTDAANLRFGSSNFTIEAWVYRSASGATQTIASKGAATPTGWVFQISSADKLVFTDTSTSITGATSIATNTWTYVAVVRAGTGSNQTTLYVNGTSDGTGTSATNFNQTSNMLIGADRSSTNFANGYISNLRLSNTNRTISSTPTTALTADANTIFLSLNINRFQYTDSTSAFTNITVTGTPSVVPFSPFAPTSAWSASTVGGSGYFDGTSDQLTETSSALFSMGTGQFTIEFWVYRTASAFQTTFTSNSGSTSIQMFVDGSNNAQLWITASQLTSNFGSLALNSWNHVAIVRDGSSNMSAYVNGVRGYTAVRTDNLNNVGIRVGGRGGDYLSGYLFGFRWVSGATLYSGTSFTVPTSPPTATPSSGTTVLLLNFTNSGVYDATSKNVLETVGTAQVSNTQAKFGTTSLFFDGVTSPADYLILPLSPYTRIGASDYTLEMWLRPGNVANLQALLSFGSGSFRIFLSGQNPWFLNGSSSIFQPGTNTFPTANVWYHYAMVRKGSTGTNCAMWVNGTRISTGFANTTDFNTGTPQIAAESGGNLYQGYMQDFRLTRFARYDPANSTITVPAAAFPLQ